MRIARALSGWLGLDSVCDQSRVRRRSALRRHGLHRCPGTAAGTRCGPRSRGAPNTMNTSPILLPVVAMVAWTFVVWTWMYATRLPAMARAKMPLDSEAPRGQQMASLPPRVRWKGDNYNHLMEQPPFFCIIAIVLALVGAGDGLNLVLAWSYVCTRIAHSLVQSIGNRIAVRFALFVLGSVILAALTVRAALALL